MHIIKVNIYGQKDKIMPVGCSSKKCSCNLCSSKEGCSDCNSAASRNTVRDLYNKLSDFLNTTDLAKYVEINFIELNYKNINYDKSMNSDEISRVVDVIERGFEPPITVIDGIIRYCGGISNVLVYKDVKELLS
ncbi:hypothetical protein J2Z42_000750 [Clostridium algifaecis]|uniref:Uncharacterized protein n=1 Tax=Clostridium algifaecis TaxID=1472040 RepID=A0ABS4KPW9_9CLOT|nr:hypothetical protein [Clostridium algifaecis]MBP2032085.1 hypothetical protein [Clostridium algifaecis]